MKHLIRLAIAAAVVLSLPAAAKAGQYVVSAFSVKVNKYDALGKLKPVSFSKGAFLLQAVTQAAGELNLGPADLIPFSKTIDLVYDDAADVLQVVSKTDGSMVLGYVSFSDGLTISGADPNSEVRLALLTLEGQATPSGSAEGAIKIVKDTSGATTAVIWTASFQFSQPANVLLGTPDFIGTGSFTTGKKFVPLVH